MWCGSSTTTCSIQAVPPEPRIVYKVNDHLDLFAGGELLGEAYKTSYRNDLRPQEANGSTARCSITARPASAAA